MYNVKTLNKIAACGTDLLDRSKYTVGDDIDNPVSYTHLTLPTKLEV